MNILVTGVAGFIGSNLAEELIEKGHKVIGIDCFTDYYARGIKENNLKKLINSSNFTFIEKDILKTNMSKLFKEVEAVFHEAAQPGVRNSWGIDFNNYVTNNILATQKILEAAKATSIKHLIYASSSSIYGNSEGLPMNENS